MTSDREAPQLRLGFRTMTKWSTNNRGVMKSWNKLAQSQSTANLVKVRRAQKAPPASQALQKWTRLNNQKKYKNLRIEYLIQKAIEQTLIQDRNKITRGQWNIIRNLNSVRKSHRRVYNFRRIILQIQGQGPILEIRGQGLRVHRDSLQQSQSTLNSSRKILTCRLKRKEPPTIYSLLWFSPNSTQLTSESPLF